jgi:hypothetical protein
MTIFQFAYFRCARQAMKPGEVEEAQALAAKADAGNAGAATALRAMCDVVIRRRRLENRYGGGDKAGRELSDR